MIPTPNEIKNFMEIFHKEHLTRAALSLGITQPSLTQSLNSLESKIGQNLFHRTRQGMVPTREAKIFYRKATTLLESWNELEADFRVNREQLSGRFKIGAHISVAIYCIPKLIENLDRFEQKIDIELVHDFSKKILEKIISYEIDLGFVVNPVHHPDLVLKKITNDQVQFWVKNGLKKIPKRLICDLSLNQVSELLSTKNKEHFRNWVYLQSESLEFIRESTESGHGVGILPERVAKQSKSVLTRYSVSSNDTFLDEVYLAYRKEVINGEAAKILIQSANIKL